jgi:hypothetical protein
MDLFKKALQFVGAIAIVFTLVFAIKSNNNGNSPSSTPVSI